MSNVKKDYVGNLKQSQVSEKDLEKINKLARKEQTVDSVYVFNVILCDNEVDRDYEKFSITTLNKLAPMFIGKTGIFDHNMKAGNQVARIFETRIETDFENKTSLGENITRLVARAYMVRTKKNEELISEIDAGIKKEVSVSCSVSNVRCSICQKDRKKQSCSHVLGKVYGESLCYNILENPTDTYEWSFVAVPAQVGAGVTKAYKLRGNKGEKEMDSVIKSIKTASGNITLSADEIELLKNEIAVLEQLAEDGKLYKSHLRQEVSKMCCVTVPQINMVTFGTLLNRASTSELVELKSAFSKKMSESIPPAIQLAYTKNNNGNSSSNMEFKM